MDDPKLFWLNRHPCSFGLSKEAIEELAELAVVEMVETGQEVQPSNQPVTSILLIIKGRLQQTLVDKHGRVLERSYLTSGSQYGILAAAQCEPVPIQVLALEPSTFLRLDFGKALSLAAKYPELQLNLFRIAGNQLRRILHMDRIRHQPASVVIVHQSPSTRLITQELLQRLARIEKRPCVFSDNPDWHPIPELVHRSIVEDGQIISREEVRRQAWEWSHLGRLFFDVDASFEIGEMCALLETTEMVLWCVTSMNWRESVTRLRDLSLRVPKWREKISLVWLLSGDQKYAPSAAEILELVDRDFKVSFCDPPANTGNQLRYGIDRIIHHLRGVRIGLALGGGAARGMAHLGVLKALEENGIAIDMIAGTSAGAMIGTVYASGLDIGYSIRQFSKDLQPSWLFRSIPSGSYWHLLYKYRCGHFDPMLRKYLSQVTLEELPIPMHTVTVDLVSGSPLVRETGDAVEVILESINLPVLSSPICHSGQALVDGGLVKNIPADVLVSQGCNYVIAVSVTAELEKEFSKIRPDSLTIRPKSPSTLQTILRGYLVQHVNMNSVGVQPADFVIEPDVISYGLTDFSCAKELAQRGEDAAKKTIHQIRSALSHLDSGLFSGHPLDQETRQSEVSDRQ